MKQNVQRGAKIATLPRLFTHSYIFMILNHAEFHLLNHSIDALSNVLKQNITVFKLLIVRNSFKTLEKKILLKYIFNVTQSITETKQ